MLNADYVSLRISLATVAKVLNKSPLLAVLFSIYVCACCYVLYYVLCVVARTAASCVLVRTITFHSFIMQSQKVAVFSVTYHGSSIPRHGHVSLSRFLHAMVGWSGSGYFPMRISTSAVSFFNGSLTVTPLALTLKQPGMIGFFGRMTTLSGSNSIVGEKLSGSSIPFAARIPVKTSIINALVPVRVVTSPPNFCYLPS